MMEWLIWGLAYLLGSIPCGVLIARTQKLNIRKHGSGNIGATNVARMLGKKAGLLTLGGDCLKGITPVAIADQFLENPVSIAIAGFVAFAGHIFSIFLKFKGGKGVATSLGIFIYLIPLPTLCSIGIFSIAILTGYVSIGSITAAISLPITGWLFQTPQPYLYLTVAVAILIILKHLENIQRLFTGTEPRFLEK